MPLAFRKTFEINFFKLETKINLCFCFPLFSLEKYLPLH